MSLYLPPIYQYKINNIKRNNVKKTNNRLEKAINMFEGYPNLKKYERK